MTLRRLLIVLALVAAPTAGAALLQGCISESGPAEAARVVQIDSAQTAQTLLDEGTLPGGPDAIGGVGSGAANDVGDFVLMNRHVRAVVDQPGLDPDSRGGSFPLTNLLAPTGGTLVDLASRRSDNDQWGQMGQGVLGSRTVVDESGGGNASAQADATNEVFVDTGPDFVTSGVQDGDTLTILSGPNAGISYQIASVVDPDTLALFIQQGLPYQDDGPGIDYTITHTTSPLSNIVVYDSAEIRDPDGNVISGTDAGGDPVTLTVIGAIQNANPGEVPDGAAVDPASGRLEEAASGDDIVVETDYILARDSHYVTVESRIVNPGSNPVALHATADIVITGGTSTPNVATWTPLAGFQNTGGPALVPFVGFRGRDLPPVSYAHVDSRAGHVIHRQEGNTVAVNIQLASPSSIPASDAIAWQRHVTVGGRNDVASAADHAVALLASSPVRTDPDTGATVPNGYEDLTRIAGRIRGAPRGTTVTAIQVRPALVFDPGAPSGLAAAPGFYPSNLLGASELLISRARPRENGSFELLVPRGFAGLSDDATAPQDLSVPSGFEDGTDDATYRLLVEAPGHDDQSLLVNLPNDRVNNLEFDLRGETGTIDISVTDDSGNPVPARVLVRGMDPDGAGPTAPTPDPDFGDDPRVAGQDNVVHLLDGTGSVEVAPGAYQVVATRGLEYTLGRFPPVGAPTDFFLISAGQTVATLSGGAPGTPIQLSRALDSGSLPDPGGGTFQSFLRRYVAADFHVHAGRSFDSAVPLEDRVISYLANGVELMVSTEHDNLVDFGPTIAELDGETTQDLDAMITSQVGVESTGFVGVDVPSAGLEYQNTIGHYNAWPLSVDPLRRRNGAPSDEYRSPADLYEDLRGEGASLVQMNHPRFPVSNPPLPPIGLGFLTNEKPGFPQPNTGGASLGAGGYETPLRSSSGADADNDGSLDDMADETNSESGSTDYNDFDTLELFGGVNGLYDIQKLDWFAMMSAGYVRTATANSDSHGVTGAPGFPRSYVFAEGGTTTDASTEVGTVDLGVLNDTLLPALTQTTAAGEGTTCPTLTDFFPAEPRAGAVDEIMDVFGTSGPVVALEVDADQDGTFENDGGEFGDLFASDDGASPASNQIDVRLTVLAAPWVPVDSVRVLINGFDATASPLTGFGGQEEDRSGSILTDVPYPTDANGDPVFFSTDLADVVRVRETFTITLPDNSDPAVKPAESDDWLIVEARGTTTGTDLFDLLVPINSLDVSLGNPNQAVGFSNPVFIDRVGGPGGTASDGEFDPPGVP